MSDYIHLTKDGWQRIQSLNFSPTVQRALDKIFACGKGSIVPCSEVMETQSQVQTINSAFLKKKLPYRLKFVQRGLILTGTLFSW